MFFKFKLIFFTAFCLLTSCKQDHFFENKILGEVIFSSSSESEDIKIDTTLICKDKKNKSILFTYQMSLKKSDKYIWIPEKIDDKLCQVEINKLFIKNDKQSHDEYRPYDEKNKQNDSFKKIFTIGENSINSRVYKYQYTDKNNEIKYYSRNVSGKIEYSKPGNKMLFNLAIVQKLEKPLDRFKYLELNFSKQFQSNNYFYLIEIKNTNKETKIEKDNIKFIIENYTTTDSLEFANPETEPEVFNRLPKCEPDKNKLNSPIYFRRKLLPSQNCVLILKSTIDREFNINIKITDFDNEFSLHYNPTTGINFGKYK
ncbi:MAG: hypothetical protein DCC88_06190 [Spirobacillus cienkowskii]|uniref:Lipoprotein n=1 Tax=Spirobacillus cienkowskii TaxID=495820 RepID=A0A369KWZ8_9BACT|nr:MAG: hypothetical protein DCC88_06190 [Spirobacillus cienkowskii]